MTSRQAVDQAFSRRRALSAMVLGVTFAMGTGLGVALVQAHDPRLDEASMALQKAAALVEAARTDADTTTDPVSAQTQHEFDRHREKALASIVDAMEHIAALRRRWIPTVPSEAARSAGDGSDVNESPDGERHPHQEEKNEQALV